MQHYLRISKLQSIKDQVISLKIVIRKFAREFSQFNMVSEYTICPEDERLGALVMEALTTLLASNVQNANVFRECGGARCAHNLVPYVDCRYQALGIVRELILSAGGDDDMATLLGVMHSAPPNALILKTHILKVSLIYGSINLAVYL